MRDHQYRRSDSNIRKSVNETDKGWVKRQKEIQRKCYIKSQRCRIGRRKISTTSNAGERSCKIKHWKVVTGFCNKIIDDLRDGKFDQGLRCTLVTVNWRAARRWSELIKYRLLVFWFGFFFFERLVVNRNSKLILYVAGNTNVRNYFSLFMGLFPHLSFLLWDSQTC